MAYNKIVLGDETVLDLTGDTVTADKLAEGYTAHDASGAQITGTMTGGGGDTASGKWKDVNFVDYDGSILYGYTIAELQALTELPTLPTHDGLTCQGWNWSLADLKTTNRAMIVGAMYITDDGKTRLYIDIPESGRMSPKIYWSQTAAYGVVVDWGDGSPSETFGGASSCVASHTYTSAGSYVVTLFPTSGTLSLGQGKSNTCVLGSTTNSNIAYVNMLKRVEIGENVPSIGKYAFYACYNLKSITLPQTVTLMNDYAFNNCYGLECIIIPNGQTEIKTSLLSTCRSLFTVSIPNSVLTIKNNALATCPVLKNITIPNSVTEIGSTALKSCGGITDLELPSTGSSICDGCYGLKTVKIQSGVTELSYSMLLSCFTLEHLYVPSTVTVIGNYALRSCLSLCSVDIPDGVTTIGEYSFANCNSLSSIIIPASVTSIQANAFNSCKSLGAIHFRASSPATVANINAWSGIPEDCVIYVPIGSLSLYTSATNYPSGTIYTYMEE